MPNLLSAAMATHFFPFIAKTAPPLYDIIDWKQKMSYQYLLEGLDHYTYVPIY